MFFEKKWHAPILNINIILKGYPDSRGISNTYMGCRKQIMFENVANEIIYLFLMPKMNLWISAINLQSSFRAFFSICKSILLKALKCQLL